MTDKKSTTEELLEQMQSLIIYQQGQIEELQKHLLALHELQKLHTEHISYINRTVGITKPIKFLH